MQKIQAMKASSSLPLIQHDYTRNGNVLKLPKMKYVSGAGNKYVSIAKGDKSRENFAGCGKIIGIISN